MVSVKVGLLIVVPIVYVVTVILNILSSLNVKSFFHETIKNSSKKYNAPFTPAGWAFSIWSVIYTWQGLIAVYMVVSLFYSFRGAKLYTNPHIFSEGFLICYLLNFVMNIAWLFTFSKASQQVGLLPLSSFLLFATSFFLYLTIFIAYRNSWRAYLEGTYFESKVLYLVDIIIIHNGIMIYATWTTVAQFLNCAVSLIYFNNVDPQVASVIALSFLLIVIVTYVLLDLIVLDKHTRYVFTPHCVLVWALTASLAKNYGKYKSITSFLALLVTISVFALVVKIVVAGIRHRYMGNKVLDGDTGETMVLRDE